MLKIEKFVTPSPEQWEITVEGMRNAMNSWDRMDSRMLWGDPSCAPDDFDLGPNDRDLAMRLNKGGAPHAKYRRYLPIHVTINAPLYWWKEFETYRVGVASNPSDIEFNSCSTMHKIHAKEFTMDDFSFEDIVEGSCPLPLCTMLIDELNYAREKFLETKNKMYWKRMIKLLPTSYNQKRTIMLNYEVLHNIYESRLNHKLSEWHVLCDWIEKLPYSEVIIGEELNAPKT